MRTTTVLIKTFNKCLFDFRSLNAIYEQEMKTSDFFWEIKGFFFLLIQKQQIIIGHYFGFVH